MLLPVEFTDPVVQGETSATAPWSDVYQDENLKALINEALLNNRDLKVAIARIDEAKAVLGFTRADQFPAVNLGGDAQRGDLGLSYELDLWGKYQNATAAQRAVLLSTTYAQRAVTTALVADVANLYFALLDLDRRVEIAERTLKNRKEATKLIDARLQKGIVAELDLNQAQFEEADVGASLQRIKRGRWTAENALLVLVGRSTGGIKRAPVSLFDLMRTALPAGVPANLLERRPDLLALEEQIKAELYQEGVAWAQRLPSVDITGTLGLATPVAHELFDADSRQWGVGGSLFSPLIDWGKNRSR
ncbi:MAG: hypothetical protein EBV03_09770, partial [Proteobacteria bacterium]|nr:hypothetical protein [Pseudomonadota bacterium]